MAKSGTGVLAHNRTTELLISGLSSNPIFSAISIASKMAGYVSEEYRYNALLQQSLYVEQAALLNTCIRARNEKLDQLGGIDANIYKKQPFSQIPVYYTSINQPLTDLSSLAIKANQEIKPLANLLRSALIVAGDSFRSSLLQSELNKYGFHTKIAPLGTDPQALAKQWGADVILGIRQIEDPSKKYYTDLWKKYPPPFPPDNPGAAGVRPSKIPQPQIPQNWDWGKQFTPTYPKRSPGGVTMEQLAKSFVDKGNWSVMTSVSLFYNASSSIEIQTRKEESKR